MVDLPPLRRTHYRDRLEANDQVNQSLSQARHSIRPKPHSSMTNLNKRHEELTEPREQRTTAHFPVSTSPPPEAPLPFQSSTPCCPETYLCTFCWHPHHQSTSPSCIIGRRARLACTPCYNALLDLAVC